LSGRYGLFLPNFGGDISGLERLAMAQANSEAGTDIQTGIRNFWAPGRPADHKFYACTQHCILLISLNEGIILLRVFVFVCVTAGV
jgi:hypothetical protein